MTNDRFISIFIISCILLGIQSSVSAQSSNWVYSPYTQYLTNDTTIPPPVGEPADAALSCFRHDTIYALIMPTGQLYIWLRPDPLMDKYIQSSPYAYCDGNPLKYVDPEGEWLAVVNNDEAGTYTVKGGSVEYDDCNIYIVDSNYDIELEGKPKDATILAQTATPYSFTNDAGNVVTGSIIDMNDLSGNAFIEQFQKDKIRLIPYILPPCFSNVSGWRNGNCDFKSKGNPNRGMPIAILGGKIGTARDVGNFAAGFLAAFNGITFRTSMNVFDAFQNLTTRDCTTGEPNVSKWAQQLGHSAGRSARFANRACLPNIYKAYR